MLFVLTSNLTLFRQSYNVIFPSLTKIMHNASFFYIFFCTFVRFLSTFWLSFLFQYGYVNHIEVAYEKNYHTEIKENTEQDRYTRTKSIICNYGK